MKLGIHRTALVAGVALTLATGCAPTQELETIQARLADIQRQVLQLQVQAPSKTEVQDLSSEIAGQQAAIVKAEADMLVRLEGLSAQIEQLESKLEDTNFRLSTLSQQIAATNQELKAVRNLPRYAPPGDGTFGGGDPGPPPADPQALYDAAYSDYLRGSFDLAVRQFQEYLANFVDTELSDNAAYWIGECFYKQAQFRQAIAQFDRVLDRYRESDKVPSAVLKKGYAYIELGERSQGIVQLQFVIRQFPSSDEARLARQRLTELGVGTGRG